MIYKLAFVGVVAFVPAVSMAGAIDSTSGLIYDLDAGSGVTADGANKVSAWQSQFATTPVFSQTDANKQPTFVAGSVGTLNNRPYLRFDGDLTGNASGIAPNADELIYSTSTAPRTVFVVNRLLQNRAFAAVWGVEQADSGVRRTSAGTAWSHPGNTNDFTNTGAMYVNGGSGAADLGVGPNVWHILSGTTGATPTFAATSIGDYFKSGTNTPRSYNGDVAEVVVYNRVLSDVERQAVEQELGAKYGISVV
ncbi:MAG TPA: hypothetical protein VF796_16700, partial [Humisphaera sp.]